jgi:hypothetical protein
MSSPINGGLDCPNKVPRLITSALPHLLYLRQRQADYLNARSGVLNWQMCHLCVPTGGALQTNPNNKDEHRQDISTLEHSVAPR